ncbi:heavy metal translocating P-type ATPase [Haloterrigena turkmenica DSM 5511]|uniref:Heavy metal translocating P-type ATPase n=1 Tax=Haloterrigena turkmenica (strain ATCC 51198 / DSM 5511 / JCM 9101 / NCIMB 13204 / VKM B-1734 / 4k) TaxID=543526 RepID=D2RVK2_HALTV|nr:cation-translocating P-type ATPase [Haloterrigena turkmenica]ADB59366.1 heavy metal translocating P-type ATPase [Haloterrigena turkmenica DSM 5511]
MCPDSRNPDSSERPHTPAPSSPAEGSDGCDLCDLPLPSVPITDPDVDGTYCCRGCLEVARTLERRDDGPDEAAVRSRLDGADAAGGRDLDDLDGEDAFLAVDGMHCSTCEAFLESVAEREAGVLGATASYATDTIRIVYDPDRLAADDLPEIVSGYGYTAADRSGADGDAGSDDGLARLLLGGFFGMMVMVWYVLFLYPTYFDLEPVVAFGGYELAFLSANIWAFTSFILFYTGYPILRGAYVSLRAGRPNMDLLVATAALGSYGYSAVAIVLGESHLYFDVTVAVVLVVTAGTHYERAVKRRATGLLSELTERQVDEARLESGETVPLEAVEPGDRLLVRPGERVPLDGEVLEGSAAVDESLVTGESLPVRKTPGDELRGGTVVTDAPIVLGVGDEAESTLDRLVSLLWSIQSARPGVQRLADKLATVFVPLVVALAVSTAAVLLATGSSPSTALLIGLTVVIVSCPCALGLATPLAIAAGVQAAAKRGIVVAAETIFEDAPDVDVVVLDKTGTLTTGKMAVEGVHVVDGTDSDELLRRAGAVESLSEHPIAAAVVEAAPVAAADGIGDPATGTDGSAVDSFERADRGVSGVVDGDRVVVGHPDFCRERGLSVPDSLESPIEDARAAGRVPVGVGWDGRTRGVVAVGDSEREELDAALESLSSGREIVVLTGDEGPAAERFRAVDGVDEVFAGVPPEAKAETVDRLRRRGTVAMVGDGSNDAPALAAADVGIAMGGGTQLATDAADAVIVGDDLEAVGETLEITASTHRRIRQNLGWAFCYNAVAIPLAVAGLLNPLFAAVAMAASSLLVVLNSSRSLR